MSALNFYHETLHNFVNFHISDFNASKIYEKDVAAPELTYIPDPQNKQDPTYIVNKPYYKDFINYLIDNIFYDSEPVFDLKGHLGNYDGKTLNYFEHKDDYLFSRDALVRNITTKVAIDAYKVYVAIKNKTIFNKNAFFLFLFGDDSIELTSTQSCSKCSKYTSTYLNFKENKIQTFETTDEPCAYKDKKQTNVKVNLSVPSKKLVFLNNPRKFFNQQRNDKHSVSINSTLGCVQETEFYASHNIGFFFVGNTMLDALKNGKDILIANFDEDDEESEYAKKLENYENVGSVVMDLWWYTLLDYDLYMSLCSSKNVDPDSIDHVTIDIDGTNISVNHSLKAHSKGHFWGIHSKIKVKK